MVNTSSTRRTKHDSTGLVINKYTDRTLPLLRLLLILIMAGIYLATVHKDLHYVWLFLIVFYAVFTFVSAPFRQLTSRSPFVPVMIDVLIILLFCQLMGGIDSPFLYLFFLPVLVNTINTRYSFLSGVILMTIVSLTILAMLDGAGLRSVLYPASGIIIIGFFFKILLDKDFHILSRFATRDGLTGLYTHRYFYEQLRLLINSNRTGLISLIIIDLNDFKRLNDEWGHLEGDKVLKEVARAIEKSVRNTDLVARYGGDEFAIILPGVGGDLCTAKSEQIRQSIVNLGYFSDVAIGSALYPFEASTIDALVELADKRMYHQKRRQHNKKFIHRWRD